MLRVGVYCFILSTILSFLCNAKQDSINADLVNSKVDRKIDVASHLVKTSTSITIENKGKSAASSYLYTIEPNLRSKLAFISASVKDGDKKLKVLSTSVSSLKDHEVYRVSLSPALEGGKSVTIDVETVFSHALRPFPAEITQAEKQLVVYESNLYFYSPYKTTTQTSLVNLASSNIESYTKTKPVSNSDNTITYGPYENKDAFAQDNLRVHYENNSPFLTVTSMLRVIEVSHWGNVAVEEHIEMRHSGATLKGSFSRYDYQRNQDGAASIKSFKTILPSSARDSYYRDEIGNISTSHLREMEDSVELELRPRFPLFGGWKTKYYIGYNVPSYEYLFNKGDDYVLKMRVVDHVYDDQLIDQLTLKIILPEGAKSPTLKPPYELSQQDYELHHTYLDTVGRTVIVATKSNLVEAHIQDFELHYTFQKMFLLQEPFLVVGAFYLLFLLVIIYVRLDFSITKDELKESRMRVAGILEEVQSAQDKRSALYQTYDDAINRFKASKDSGSFLTSRKKIDVNYKQLTKQIEDLLTQLKMESTDAAEKVAELQRYDQQYREQINQAITYAEKLVANKMSKPQYIDSETATESKRKDINSKLEALLENL
ncbi:dolichyl-diphosphooligosaccharide--protein glycosyltransferase subunit 1-like [Liolophura sinensis]|uniref:dolichyl-diphosphooligosaccharide--protein glycosyltransferase subunit 1-like n=1 Tax=Liolophura sinensis TaxID=3198878 RepID=UPI003158184D